VCRRRVSPRRPHDQQSPSTSIHRSSPSSSAVTQRAPGTAYLHINHRNERIATSQRAGDNGAALQPRCHNPTTQDSYRHHSGKTQPHRGMLGPGSGRQWSAVVGGGSGSRALTVTADSVTPRQRLICGAERTALGRVGRLRMPVGATNRHGSPGRRPSRASSHSGRGCHRESTDLVVSRSPR
jgi:hypothetical protein